jgi:hypothetical protein
MAGVVCLVYYLLPTTLFGAPVWWVLLIAPLLLAIFEVLRLTFGWRLPGLRPHERRRPASYVAWGAGLVLLVAFFPEAVAVPCVLGAAFVDPLLGVLRAAPRSLRWVNPWLPWGAYVALAAPIFESLAHAPGTVALFLAGTAAAVAIVAERPNLAWLDDDLLMPLVPALLWVPLTWVVPGAEALAFHLPWQRG